MNKSHRLQEYLVTPQPHSHSDTLYSYFTNCYSKLWLLVSETIGKLETRKCDRGSIPTATHFQTGLL